MPKSNDRCIAGTLLLEHLAEEPRGEFLAVLVSYVVRSLRDQTICTPSIIAMFVSPTLGNFCPTNKPLLYHLEHVPLSKDMKHSCLNFIFSHPWAARSSKSLHSNSIAHKMRSCITVRITNIKSPVVASRVRLNDPSSFITCLEPDIFCEETVL